MSLLIKHDPLSRAAEDDTPSRSSGTSPVSPRLGYMLLAVGGVVTLLWLIFLGWAIYRLVAWVAGA